MFEIVYKDYISCAHKLKDYQGKCENLHGHNWKIEIFIQGEKLNELGLLIDFNDVKRVFGEIKDKLDHKYLNELVFFKNLNPSCENLAKFIFIELKKRLEKFNVNLKKVTVWESHKTSASYME